MMITADFAGVPIGVGLSYDSYRKFFEAQQTEAAPAASVIVGEADRRRAAEFYPAGSTDAYIEYMELCRLVSDVLIPFRRTVFHGCAFLWRGRVVLLCAPSGTGKTTHYVRWKQLCGDEIQILNGDKPVLFARQEGDVTVHPSPWHGKEGMGQPISAASCFSARLPKIRSAAWGRSFPPGSCSVSSFFRPRPSRRRAASPKWKTYCCAAFPYGSLPTAVTRLRRACVTIRLKRSGSRNEISCLPGCGDR